jgi:hypothetical protein
MQGTLSDNEEDTQIYVCDINPNMLNVGKSVLQKEVSTHLFSFILPSLAVRFCCSTVDSIQATVMNIILDGYKEMQKL